MIVVSVLWTAFFLINFNVAMMIPLLPFIQRDVGLSAFQAGMVLAAFPVTALISNLVLGPFIDRFGRKRFIVSGALACALVYILTAASRNALPIALGRAATGVFMPMVGASIFAGIADYVPLEARARVTGYVATAAPIAFLLSMSMGVWLGGLLAWQLPLVLIAVVALGLAACALTLPPTPVEALSQHPVTVQTYRRRLLSLSLESGTRLLLLSYFCWAAAVYTFLGLYPSWIVQNGLAGYGVGTIGALLFFGEIGGLSGAFLSGRLAAMFRHPMGLCSIAAIAAAVMVLVVPLCTDMFKLQAVVYAAFAFTRDLMLSLMLGGAMLLVPAPQRGSLNAILNAIYQTGGTLGGVASALLYARRPDFEANACVAGGLFFASGLLLWGITRVEVQGAASPAG